jgi:hypothetical protein
MGWLRPAWSERVYSPWEFISYSYPNTNSCMPSIFKAGMGSADPSQSDEITQSRHPGRIRRSTPQSEATTIRQHNGSVRESMSRAGLKKKFRPMQFNKTQQRMRNPRPNTVLPALAPKHLTTRSYAPICVTRQVAWPVSVGCGTGYIADKCQWIGRQCRYFDTRRRVMKRSPLSAEEKSMNAEGISFARIWHCECIQAYQAEGGARSNKAIAEESHVRPASAHTCADDKRAHWYRRRVHAAIDKTEAVVIPE